MFRTVLALATALTGIAYAEIAGSCDQVFTAAIQAGKLIELDLRAGNIEVFGTPELELRVACHLDDPSTARDIRIDFAPNAKGGRLRITGGPNNGVRLRIYVPQRSDLDLDCSAGNVDIKGVEGNKDLGLRAGNLTVNDDKPRDYYQVEASVTAGNVNAPRFGGEKSGLFRSFKANNSGGKYQLKAHVTAGNIEIK
jgi:hypothetical protein